MTTFALHGSLNEREKLLDRVALSLGRSEAQVKRPLATNSGRAGHSERFFFFCRNAKYFEDPYPATSEVSGQTFTRVFNRTHLKFVWHAAFLAC